MKEGAPSFSSSGLHVSTAHFISRILRNSSIKGAGWIRKNLTQWVADSPQHPVVRSVEVYEYILTTNEYKAFKAKGGKQLLFPLVPIRGISDLPVNDNIFYMLPSRVEALPKAMFQP